MDTSVDKQWITQALMMAHRAQELGEVPVGAVLVLNNQKVAEGWNQSISLNDPTAHAEIIALREGAKKLGNYRLLNATLYVTLEPCVMCLGALVHARIERLVYGADDPKAGAITSAFNILHNPAFNHKFFYEKGVLAQECGDLLKNFFAARRVMARSNSE